jgi:hypothetical protein
MTESISNSGNTAAAHGAFDATPGSPDTEGLSPDALLVYLSTRLGGLEDQINGYFAQQERADQLRGLLNDMKVLIQGLNEHTEDMNQVQYGAEGVMNDLNAVLDQIAEIDPNLATALGNNLSRAGFIMNDGSEIQLGDDAMIHLQALGRAHETAVSLGTNLVEAAGRTTQKIADRIGG